MTYLKVAICTAALALLASIFVAAIGVSSDYDGATASAISVNAIGNDTASIPDFDGDGTIGFGDFLIFAGVFGSSQGDGKYDATYDLNGDGEIGFSDFVIFAQDFGKDVPSPVVSIPDANLRAAIEDALGKASGAPFTVADMYSLDVLRAGSRGINDLTGLEYAANLTELRLDVNNIHDVSVLGGLINLTSLALGFNDITDVSALAGLTNLTSLRLTNNSIVDVSALAGLANLTFLGLSGNRELMDVSTLSDLNNLTVLRLGGNAIADVSALAGLTNLTWLGLTGNRIMDVSALSDLTNLTTLKLLNNAIMDVSALAGLTNLRQLELGSNNIAGISALSDLTNLRELELGSNNIADISALSDLTNLTRLELGFNFGIRDISALVGLTRLKSLDIRGNPLSQSSINDRIPFLKSNGVAVLYDFWRAAGDFDIELVLLSSFTERQKEDLKYAVRRWMAVITKDLPDYTFTQNWSGRCGGQPYEISAGERIDDLRIYVRREEMEVGGWGGPRLLREETHLPVVGCMAFSTKETRLLPSLAIHEMGHVLGFGTIWEILGFYQNPPDGDKHFNGPLAIAAFNDAGGRNYTGKKVPLENRAHWRLSVLPDEVLITGSGRILSAITVQSLADLGYGVDFTQSDPYTIPGAAGKMAVSTPAVPGLGINAYRLDVFAQSGADQDVQGSIQGKPLWVPENSRTGLPEGAEPLWEGGLTLDLADGRHIWDVALPSYTAPELTCGAGLMNEPIYVVDPQGRIVRTISR